MFDTDVAYKVYAGYKPIASFKVFEDPEVFSSNSKHFEVCLGSYFELTEVVHKNGTAFNVETHKSRSISFEIPKPKHYGVRLWDTYGNVYFYHSHIEEEAKDLYFTDMRFLVNAIEEAIKTGFVSRGLLYWQLFEHDCQANQSVRVVDQLLVKGDLLKKAQPLCQDTLLGKILQLSNVTVTQYQLTGVKLDKQDDFVDQWYIYEVIYQGQSFVYASGDTFKPTAKLSFYDYGSAEDWKYACRESYTRVKLTKIYSRTYNKQ